MKNDDTYFFCRLQFVVETFEHSMNQSIQNSLKSSKLLSQRIRKSYYQNLGTSVINSILSPFYLHNWGKVKGCNVSENYMCGIDCTPLISDPRYPV